MKIGGRNGPNPPFGARGEGLRLVVAGGGRDDCVAGFGGGFGGGGCQIGLLSCLLLNLGNLLTLC